MKKQLLTVALGLITLGSVAQTPRLSLYEEFTGETCPPCASTNPPLDALFAQPAIEQKAVMLKWQVPIPSASSKTWSLYQTNKAEIDWRYRSVAGGGYGYAVNSAPSARIDGQSQTAFGAIDDHPARVINNPNIISTAQSYTSAFSVTMDTEWTDATYSAINVTVNILATADFTATGNLVFRTVMIEREIHFATQPGTNGEKDFSNVAIKSFPDLQNGTALTGAWTMGNTYSFTLNCPLPSYTRNKFEVGFVGFIQDDGDRKVAQTVRAKPYVANDIKAVSASIAKFTSCTGNADVELTVSNEGNTTITDFTVTPYYGSTAQAVTVWSNTTGLAPGASTTIPLTPITSTVDGVRIYTLDITAVSGTDGNETNNKVPVTVHFASAYSRMAVAEGFVTAPFPPANWAVKNSDGGSASWSRVTNAGGYGMTPNAAKYNFFANAVVGDADELILPPLDLDGSEIPVLYFDVAYAQYNTTTYADDSLYVYVSEDCGETWVAVYSNGSSNLSTASPITSAFTPNAGQWRTEEVPLDQFSSLATILVKFVAVSDNGNNLYLDNINLEQANPTGIKTVKRNTLGVELYPNPAQTETNIKISTLNNSNAKISVMNVLGQTVYTKDVFLNIGENNISLNTAQLAEGVYNVLINTDRGTTVKKLSVAH